MMDSIQIADFEVYYHVGVPDAERATPQRLLITVEMFLDFVAAAAGDDLTKTINYFEVCERLSEFGRTRQRKLIEKLASDIAAMILRDFRPQSVTVEVKKFIIPQARFVSVRLNRSQERGA